MIREVFSDQREMTRNYLRILVDTIVLHGEVAEVVVRTDGAAALMAQGDSLASSSGTLTGPDAAPTSVRGWLPSEVPRRNRPSRLFLAPRERPEAEKKPPKIVSLIERAEEFRRLLDSGQVRNQAELARTFGLTRARVTQLLQLLDLHPDILAYARGLPPGTPTKFVTERGLRPLLKLKPEQQLRQARRLVQGYR